MENNLKQPFQIRRSMVLHHDIYVSCLDKCYVKGSQEIFLPEYLRTQYNVVNEYVIGSYAVIQLQYYTCSTTTSPLVKSIPDTQFLVAQVSPSFKMRCTMIVEVPMYDGLIYFRQ